MKLHVMLLDLYKTICALLVQCVHLIARTKENRDLKVAYEDVKRRSETARKQQGDIQLFLNEKLDDQYNLIDELETKLIQIKTNHKHDKDDLLKEFKTKNVR